MVPAERVQVAPDVLASDRSLVERVCADDDQALEELLGRRCRLVIRYLSQQYGYEDLQNELYVHLREDNWRRLRTWQGRSTITGWIKQVAIHLCLKHVKGLAPFQPLEKLEELMTGRPDGHHSDGPNTRRLDLLKAIQSLSDPRERILIIQHILRDRTIQAVADYLGVSRGNADVIKHRAIKHLREWFLNKGRKS